MEEKKYMAVIYLQVRHDTNIFWLRIRTISPVAKIEWPGICIVDNCVFETVICVCPAWRSGSPLVRTASWFSSKESFFASLSICVGGVNSSGSRQEYVAQGFQWTASHALGQWGIFWDNTFSELCGKRSSLFLGKSVASDGLYEVGICLSQINKTN